MVTPSAARHGAARRGAGGRAGASHPGRAVELTPAEVHALQAGSAIDAERDLPRAGGEGGVHAGQKGEQHRRPAPARCVLARLVAEHDVREGGRAGDRHRDLMW
jgi:hypothetical protein